MEKKSTSTKKTDTTKKVVKKSGSATKKEKYYEAVGRRKTSTARVRLFTKKKGFTINDKEYKEYFPILRLQKKVNIPFDKMNIEDKFGVSVKVVGGGINSQSDAIKLGISRALVKFNPDFKKRLRRVGLLTRDAREVERKKPGLRKARTAHQWSKR